MTSTAEYLPVIQRTPEWIEARQHGIGASEAGAALGFSRWESPYSLWARKLGLTPPPEPTLAMEIGTITEPLNAARYAAATGTDVRRVNRLMRSKAFPFLLASLDRRRPDGRLVELKWTQEGDGYGEPGTDEVPDAVLCQAVQQMLVTGAPAVDVSVLFGGRRHAVYTVERDTAAEAVVIDRLADFWRHVEDRTEPEIDTSEPTMRTLGALRDTGEVLDADEELRALLAELRDLQPVLGPLAERDEEIRKSIKAAIGTASEVAAPGIGRATFRAPKDSVSVAWQELARALGATEAQIAEHTTVKPNSRRLVPTWDKEEAA